MSVDVKKCSWCKEIKPVSEFYIHKTGKEAGKYYSRCKFCNNQIHGEYDSEKIKFRNIRLRYGLSQDAYNNLPKECEICGTTKNLEIDHNHATSKFRGILCGLCNRGLGMFGDDPNLLIRATDYVLHHYQ